MGEALRGLPQGPPLTEDERAAGDRSSIGAYLERQRMLRHITLDELEATTRIPRRSLERLEAGAFDRDHDAFARSFVRTVATALGLDANEAVTRMLAEAVPDAGMRGARRLRTGRVLALCAAVAVLGAAFALWRAGVSLPRFSLGPPTERAIVHRRDAVRELADEARARGLRPAPPAEEDASPPQTR
ncbi:MAG TPA: helix-turn-helix domain-containing protein [Myxococcota bacterium]|nr:helix-turn-helix domain-containing protein [Myxococcota bacterium]